MYVLAPTTKRPKLPAVSIADAKIVVHDHTYMGYGFAMSTRSAFTHRLAFPACEMGCADRDACARALSPIPHRAMHYVTDWPVDYPFQIVRIDDAWRERIEAWRQSFRQSLIRTYPSLLDGKNMIRLASFSTHEFRPQDIPQLHAEYHENVPMALVDGPVPFDPHDVVKFTLACISRKPYELTIPPLFSREGEEWFVTVLPSVVGGTTAGFVPHGFSESDMGADEGTWAEPAYAVGPHGFRRSVGTWSVNVNGRTYTSPRDYVMAWVFARTEMMDNKTGMDRNLKHVRDDFIRTILINRPDTKPNGDRIRMYLDEPKSKKLSRAIDNYGPDFGPMLLQLPIEIFGPDYQQTPEPEDPRRPYDSDEDTDEEGDRMREQMYKRQRTQTSMDILISELESFMS